MKIRIVILFFISIIFPQIEHPYPPLELVSIPTAGTLPKGSYTYETTLTKNGGVTPKLAVGLTDNFLGFILGGVAGLTLPYQIANNYDASNSLLYPRKIKTWRDKELYKKTYLKEAKKLAKKSVTEAPVVCGIAFIAFMFIADGLL